MKIIKYPHKTLMQPSKDVEVFDSKLSGLIRNMKKTILKSKTGVGLSAVQVGYPIRLFIASLGLSRLEVFINPIIINYSDLKLKEVESCLSVPGKLIEIERPNTITISYYGVKQQKNEITLSGFDTRICLHEMDHLNGKLIIDYKDENEYIKGKSLSI